MPSLVPPAEEAALGSALGLSGHVCVVTGATSGIGYEVGLGLARLGMSVVAVGRSPRALESIALDATKADVRLATFEGDVRSEESMVAAMSYAKSTFGGLDAVFANAGVAAVAPALDVPSADFRNVVETNLVGAFLTARAAAACFENGGTVVFTTSSFARRGAPGWSSYNASKAALGMLTETLASEWAASGIRVNAIGPTATLTNVNRDLFADEDFTAAVLAGIPVGRLMETSELVLPVAFLLSPRNEMLTGHTLFIDGGQTL